MDGVVKRYTHFELSESPIKKILSQCDKRECIQSTGRHCFRCAKALGACPRMEARMREIHFSAGLSIV